MVVVERMVVIGCAGSGKSRLARQLAERTGLPLVERDGLGEEGSRGYLSAIAEMAAHRPQGLSALRDREHPLRWAWTSHADRHREGLALMARPGLAHTQILRFTRPVMARRWLRQLISP